MSNEITSNPRQDVTTKKIRQDLLAAEETTEPSKALALLEGIEGEVEAYSRRARTEVQKRLVERFHVEKKFRTALADATLVELLESEDEEIRLKAAKELREKVGSSNRIDKAVFVQGQDPEIERLKEGI